MLQRFRLRVDATPHERLGYCKHAWAKWLRVCPLEDHIAVARTSEKRGSSTIPYQPPKTKEDTAQLKVLSAAHDMHRGARGSPRQDDINAETMQRTGSRAPDFKQRLHGTNKVTDARVIWQYEPNGAGVHERVQDRSRLSAQRCGRPVPATLQDLRVHEKVGPLVQLLATS